MTRQARLALWPVRTARSAVARPACGRWRACRPHVCAQVGRCGPGGAAQGPLYLQGKLGRPQAEVWPRCRAKCQASRSAASRKLARRRVLLRALGPPSAVRRPRGRLPVPGPSSSLVAGRLGPEPHGSQRGMVTRRGRVPGGHVTGSVIVAEREREAWETRKEQDERGRGRGREGESV